MREGYDDLVKQMEGMEVTKPFNIEDYEENMVSQIEGQEIMFHGLAEPRKAYYKNGELYYEDDEGVEVRIPRSDEEEV